MTKSKRGERGSSSSSVSSNTELKKARMNKEEETKSFRDLIQNLTANMESNFAKLHEELCGLRQEMKEEIDTASEKKTNTDPSLLASFAEKTETRFLPGRRELKRAQGSRTLT